MKHKSFLFLIAALAMGLALFGCSTDSDSSTDYVYVGLTGDVEDIAAAFDIVDDVYLTRDITVGNNETLSIKAGKRLHLNGSDITMKDGSSVITSAVNSIIWSGKELAVADTGKIVVDNGATVYLIGPSGSFPETSVTGDLDNVVEVVPSPPGAETLIYTPSGEGAIAATTNRALVFNEETGGWKSGDGGTTVVYIGDLTIPPAPGGYTIGGSLSVAGDVTLAGSIAGANGGLEVLGKLTSNITPGVGVTLVAGNLTARSITTKGGNFGKTVAINSPSLKSLFDGVSTFTEGLTGSGAVQFTNDATFTAGATLLNNAEFGGNVTSTAASAINGNATFTGGKKITGNVSVKGPVTVSGTDGLILAANGGIAYADGVSATFLTGAGTLAALGGSISVKPGATELLIQDVSGVGTFTAGNKPITLSGNNQIRVEGTTGVYFDGAGSIAAVSNNGKTNYQLGLKGGTLYADKTFILTAGGIKSDGVETASRSTLKYALDNVSEAAFLGVGSGGQLTITNANIDVNTAGSIALAPDATIILAAAGGSITAAEVAYSGYIVTTNTASGGSLVAGSMGSMTTEAIGAGSAGTVGGGATKGRYIFASSKFIVEGSSADAATAAGSASSNPNAVISTTGSIAVFKISGD